MIESTTFRNRLELARQRFASSLDAARWVPPTQLSFAGLSLDGPIPNKCDADKLSEYLATVNGLKLEAEELARVDVKPLLDSVPAWERAADDRKARCVSLMQRGLKVCFEGSEIARDVSKAWMSHYTTTRDKTLPAALEKAKQDITQIYGDLPEQVLLGKVSEVPAVSALRQELDECLTQTNAWNQRSVDLVEKAADAYCDLDLCARFYLQLPLIDESSSQVVVDDGATFRDMPSAGRAKPLAV